MKKLIVMAIISLFLFSPLFAESAKASDSIKPDLNTFYFFYSHRCPHCKVAHPFINGLKKEYPKINFKELEVLKVPENRKLFMEMVNERGIQGGGVPTFIFGEKFVVGFQEGHHDKLIREMIELQLANHGEDSCNDDKCKKCSENIIDVPVFGKIDAKMVSLPSFTFIIGLLDGVNPCAMWVLMFLLTLLVNAKSRRKLIMVGTVFVISSGLVYFLFMTAWLNIFTFMGVANYVTIILGVVALLMGVINIKEFFFFKKGVSLMIPEKAKPKLYEKMRKVINNNNFFLSLLGTITLAFFVNLIELGCTIGLPAIYTRVLSIQEIDTGLKYFFMGLYNVYYVIPLAVIVIVFVITMGKYRFEEKHAKVLKLISGILMLSLGLILVIKPDLLVFS
jgi:thiol-disulfide isomerase/thioredoxin